jgi:hypothetical protein
LFTFKLPLQKLQHLQVINLKCARVIAVENTGENTLGVVVDDPASLASKIPAGQTAVYETSRMRIEAGDNDIEAEIAILDFEPPSHEQAQDA